MKTTVSTVVSFVHIRLFHLPQGTLHWQADAREDITPGFFFYICPLFFRIRSSPTLLNI
jgi:hypothetical protein